MRLKYVGICLAMIATLLVGAPTGGVAAATTEVVGTVTSGGVPIDGATVTLANGPFETIATTTSDLDGNYEFSELEYGTYTVSATAPANTTPYWYDVGFVDPASSAPTAIELDPLSSAATADFDFPTGGFGGSIDGVAAITALTATFTNVATGYSETVGVVDGGFGLGYIPLGDYELTVTYDQNGVARSHTFDDV